MIRSGKRAYVALVTVLLLAAIGNAALAAPAAQNGASGALTTAASYNPDRPECEFLDIINRYRASKDEPRLKLSRPLGAAADDQSENMDRRNKVYHTPDLKQSLKRHGYDGNYFGENVAGQFSSAKSVFNAWRESRGHRANMLNDRFAAIGIAEQNGYWTTIFGDRRDDTISC